MKIFQTSKEKIEARIAEKNKAINTPVPESTRAKFYLKPVHLQKLERLSKKYKVYPTQIVQSLIEECEL